MRKKSYPIAQLTGGLVTSFDPTFIADKTSPSLKNVRFLKGLVKKDLSYDYLIDSTALDGTPMLIHSFNRYDGSADLMIMTIDWAYHLKSDNTWEKKNPLAQFTGDEDDQFCAVTTLSAAGADLLVVTNGVNAIQQWDGSAAAFSALGGLAAVTAKYLATFASRLILGNTIETGTYCPKRVRWSVVGDPEDYTSTGSGFLDLVDTDDNITGFASYKDRLFIIKERSIWELVYVGGTTVFRVIPVIKEVGSYAPLSIDVMKEGLVIYCTDGIYLFDGISVVHIDSGIYTTLFQPETRIVNASKINRSCGVSIPEIKEYWICVPTAGSIPDKLFKYNHDVQAWSVRDSRITAFGWYTTSGGTAWSALTGTWAAQTWQWKETGLNPGTPILVLTDPEGHVFADRRNETSTEAMVFETKDFMFAHAQRWAEVRIQAKGSLFYVQYSVDEGVTWSNLIECAASTGFVEHIIPLNFTSQKIRVRITCSGEELEIKWAEPFYIPRLRSVNPVMS